MTNVNEMNHDSVRKMQGTLQAQPARDGAGVNIMRFAGPHLVQHLDPFLLIDEIRSDDASDYVAGFPSHPHRGFETITFLRNGRMRHEDHLGNSGVLESGGAQWMTAGRGVIHSEMPEQEEGLLHGFQLWLNLPSHDKLMDAAWRDIPAEEMPVAHFEGGLATAVAGDALAAGEALGGWLPGKRDSRPAVVEVQLEAGAHYRQSVAASDNALVYVFAGATAGLPLNSLGLFPAGEGGDLELIAGDQGAGALVLTGKPLREPVIQHGPFVMNTEAEVVQAVQDYQSGQLTN